jgi:hypothetical protein
MSTAFEPFEYRYQDHIARRTTLAEIEAQHIARKREALAQAESDLRRAHLAVLAAEAVRAFALEEYTYAKGARNV